MDKPKSLSVKDFLIRKMSVKLLKPEVLLDAIVSHQFSSAQEAMKTNNSVELSGWGKFLFKEKKAQKKLSSYMDIERLYTESLNNELPENRRHKLQMRLNSVQDAILSLKLKLDESVKHN